MDKKLRKLFEFQKFSKNEHLEQAINETLNNEEYLVEDEKLFVVAGGNNVEFDNNKIEGNDNISGGTINNNENRFK